VQRHEFDGEHHVAAGEMLDRGRGDIRQAGRGQFLQAGGDLFERGPALRGSRVTQIEWGECVRFQLDPPGEISVGHGALLADGPSTAPRAGLKNLEQVGRDEVQRAVGARILSAVGFKNGAMRIVLDSAQYLIVQSKGPFVPASVRLGDSVIWSRPGAQAEHSAL
jgi:hypothetical protein